MAQSTAAELTAKIAQQVVAVQDLTVVGSTGMTCRRGGEGREEGREEARGGKRRGEGRGEGRLSRGGWRSTSISRVQGRTEAVMKDGREVLSAGIKYAPHTYHSAGWRHWSPRRRWGRTSVSGSRRYGSSTRGRCSQPESVE